MRQYFINLETDHVVPPGTPGHGFRGPLDITVNGPQYLQNQSNAYEVMQAAAKILGQNPAQLSNILTYSDLNNASPNHDQQQGWLGCPAHRTPTYVNSRSSSFPCSHPSRVTLFGCLRTPEIYKIDTETRKESVYFLTMQR
jgi:hypothetical protein